MAELYSTIRKCFERRMRQGVRPNVYPLARLAGGEYVSKFTEIAWKEYLAGWVDAEERYEGK